MDNSNKEVLWEIMGNPITSIPLSFGGTITIYSIIDGSPLTFFAGVCFSLFAFGTGINNFIFNKENIVNNILLKRSKNLQKEKQKELEELTRNLTETFKKDDDRLLLDLKTIYFTFLDDITSQELSVPHDLVNQITIMFDACIKSLNYTFILHKQKDKVSSSLSKQIESKRNKLLNEIQNNVEILFDLINQIRMSSLNKSDNTKEMESIKKSITRSLQLARDLDKLCRGEDEIENMYEEYIKE